MITKSNRFSRGRSVAGVMTALVFGATALTAYQAKPAVPTAPAKAPASTGQKIDADYTKRIIDNTPDKRILTELVDHMPLPNDPNVPSPLKFLGYVPGENG